MESPNKRRYLPFLIIALLGIALALCLSPQYTLASDAQETSASTDATTSSDSAAPVASAEAYAAATNSSQTSDVSSEEQSSAETSGNTANNASGDATESAGGANDASGSNGDVPGDTTDSDSANSGASGEAASPAATESLSQVLTEKILYDSTNSIHYVYSTPGDATSTQIILYCMNNLAHWPHTTGTITSIPDYTQGYLDVSNFASEAQYQECMAKLEAILYAGYPYNGLNLYQVVSTGYQATEQDLDNALDAPDFLRTDFPDSIGDTVFTYSNSKEGSANYEKLKQFVLEVGTYWGDKKTTPSGLTYSQLITTAFFKAAYGITQTSDPIGYFSNENVGSYSVTMEQAYEATQNAIWVTLAKYGIHENNLTETSPEVLATPLATVLLNQADSSRLLRQEPVDSNISITSGASFTYDPAIGAWRTGMLAIGEGANYNGLYALSLPDGVTAKTQTDSGDVDVTSVTAGEQFYLVSATKPTQKITISALDTLTWIEEVRQYSPYPEDTTAPDGKDFQHMIGAVIHQKEVSTSTDVQPAQDGNISISKTVVGEGNSTESFAFTVTLSDTSVNGTYGDLTFSNGVANVNLVSGETKTALHLPAGISYTVTENLNDAQKQNYVLSGSTGTTGAIADEATATATFTNTRLYKLTVGKTVSGTANGSSTQQFPITITLTNPDGSPVSGTFSYTGGTVEGSGATAPANGTLAFENGQATVQLSSGQQITILGITSGMQYAVNEDGHIQDGLGNNVYFDSDANHAHYNLTGASSGTLSADATVALTNTVRTGTLVISKTVEGEPGSTRKFTFTVKLGGAGTGISGTFGGLTFTNGEATVQLAAGESAEASNLPEGTTYTVIETTDDNYTTTVKDSSGNQTETSEATGTIENNGISRADFVNTRKPTALPLTGSSGITPTYLLGILVLAAAAVWLHIHRNANEEGNRD